MSQVRSNLLRFGGGIIIVCLTFCYFSSKDGKADFEIRITGRNGVHFSGFYTLISDGKSINQTIDGTVPTEYSASATAVSVLIRRTEGDGTLMIEISRAGTVVNIAGNNDYSPITVTTE